MEDPTVAVQFNITPPASLSANSPRASDISFTSAQTTFSDISPQTRKPQSSISIPPTCSNKPLPVHPSSSTISRDSHMSAERQPSGRGRLPQAPVFIRDPDRPGIPPQITAPDMRFGGSQPAVGPRDLGRSVSDMPEVYRVHQRNTRALNREWSSPGRTQSSQASITIDPTDEIVGSTVSEIPVWVPRNEHRDWSVLGDDLDIFDIQEEDGRWVESMRNFGTLYRQNRSPPRIRGSILDVEPPSFAERLGLRNNNRSGNHQRERRHVQGSQNATPRRFRYRGRRREQDRSNMLRQQQHRRRAQNNAPSRPNDEYDGFLSDRQRQQEPVRSRRSWLRFFSRSRR